MDSDFLKRIKFSPKVEEEEKNEGEEEHMALQAMIAPSEENISTEREKEPNPYYSVEFSLEGLGIDHLFRLRETNSDHKCVLVREDSQMLPLLKVGDVLPLKFIFNNTPRLSDSLNTVIRFIIKQDEGRFKGHYFVGFEILGG